MDNERREGDREGLRIKADTRIIKGNSKEVKRIGHRFLYSMLFPNSIHSDLLKWTQRNKERG